ncbi:MAG: hypothetical protein EXR94_10775 [Gemmatimonadetes bacterium]|nr:hypothetical protein [Gemmatimonadota bacterium]
MSLRCLGLALVGWVSSAAAQTYRPSAFACAVFQESVATSIRGTNGSAEVADRAGRFGLLVLNGRDSSGVVVLEAWYDSLEVWRETAAGREAPETDGVVGGRFRGVLHAAGKYRPLKAPFIPDELADVADLAAVLDDFLPWLPPAPLAAGQQWSDTTGLTIRRLPDRARTHHYRWTASRRRGDRYAASDSLSVTLDQVIKETGELEWSPEGGPLGWTRQINVSARIPATGGVKRPVRSTVDQTVTVTRRPDLTSHCG